MPSRRPHSTVLFALLALAVAPPFVAQALGSTVGSYTMFDRMERYHLDLSVRTATGEVRVALRSVAPHLSREARIILLPAAGFAVGADQVDVVDEGLEDLAQFLCEFEPQALSARAVLVRESFDARHARQYREEVAACGPVRP